MKIEIDIDEKEFMEKLLEKVAYKIIEELKHQLFVDYRKELKSRFNKYFDGWIESSLNDLLKNEKIDNKSFIDIIKQRFLEEPDPTDFKKRPYIISIIDNYMSNRFSKELKDMIERPQYLIEETTKIGDYIYKTILNSALEKIKDKIKDKE